MIRYDGGWTATHLKNHFQNKKENNGEEKKKTQKNSVVLTWPTRIMRHVGLPIRLILKILEPSEDTGKTTNPRRTETAEERGGGE